MSSLHKERVRADALLTARGLAQSRAQAQALIMAGKVMAGPRRIDKAGTLLPEDAELSVQSGPRFVSRGGEKLDHALDVFEAHGLNISGFVCVDIGASTGGFTDCLLQRGASRVIAVDVGYGQLAEKLRKDSRVESRERTNARDLRPRDFSQPIDLLVIDASFVGLSTLIVPIARLLRPGAHLVALIKPQFEAGKEAARKGRGVIRDEETRQAAIESAQKAVIAAGFIEIAQTDSALRGPKGNLERFIYAQRSTELTAQEDDDTGT